MSEPPVPQHVQRKKHVFQALTLEMTWDLNKNCIIVIRDEILIHVSMHKSYNDLYTNKTAIKRNSVKFSFWVSVFKKCKIAVSVQYRIFQNTLKHR